MASSTNLARSHPLEFGFEDQSHCGHLRVHGTKYALFDPSLQVGVKAPMYGPRH